MSEDIKSLIDTIQKQAKETEIPSHLTVEINPSVAEVINKAINKHEVYYLRQDYTRLVDILYEYHLAGGNCHIVTDDDNLLDHHIDFCINCINEDEEDPVYLKHIQYALLNILKEFPEGSLERNYIATGVWEEYIE